MNITLTNVKIHEDMSEETLCFSADLFFEGKVVGKVRNRGCGGGHIYYWDDKNLQQQFLNFVETQEFPFEFEKHDQHIDRLLEDHLSTS